MRFDEKVLGYFNPKQVDTLREEAKKHIGKKLIFEYLWMIEDEDCDTYSGQKAYLAKNPDGTITDMGWVPEEDIEPIKRAEH